MIIRLVIGKRDTTSRNPTLRQIVWVSLSRDVHILALDQMCEHFVQCLDRSQHHDWVIGLK